MRIYDDGKTYSLSEPEKENYVFMGWYTSSDFTEDTKVTHVTYESGIKKIYAKWGVNITASLLGVKVEEAVAPGDTFAAFLAECDDIMSYNIDEESGIKLDGYYLMKADGTLVKIEADTVNDFSEPVTFYVVLKQNDVRYLAHSDGDNGIYTAEVIGLVSAKDDVTIVAELELLSAPHEVTEIASGVFADVDVKTAYIPATVEKIGASIFKAGSTVTVYTDKTADWADTSWKNGATVTVITKAYYVASAEEFRAAVSADAKYIRLTSDIASVGSDVQILVGAYNENREIEIDLNGKILGYRLCPSTTPDDKTDSGYRLKMTVKNGQIGTNNGKNESNVNLYYGFNLQGNGIDLVLNNVKAISYYGGLYANGRWNGNTINATGCEFLAVGVYQSNGDGGTNGAYLPGKNTYNFTNCTFAGEVGVYVKSGDTVFTNCTIKSTCDKYLVPLYNGNGSDGYGSALIIDSTKGYQTPMTVKIIGGTVTSISGYAVEEVSNAKTEAEKICYSTTTISSTTVLSGKLGRVYSENGTVTVEDENGVKAAYASTAAGVAKAMAKGGTIVLTKDLIGSGEGDSNTCIGVRAADGDVEIVLDLNGKRLGYELDLMTTIAGSGDDSGYRLKIKIINGKIGTDDGYSAADADGKRGQLYYGVLCQGNGVDLTLENVESSAYYGGLYANGQYKNNVITANNCVFKAACDNGLDGSGAYLPGQNTYKFTKCEFSGSVGVYIKSGNTTFTDCTITTNGTYVAPTYNGNGANGSGSALIIDSTKGYQTPMTVKVIGGTITSISGYAVEEVSNAKTEAEKICYSTTTISSTTVLSGKLGRVYSENGTVTIVA